MIDAGVFISPAVAYSKLERRFVSPSGQQLCFPVAIQSFSLFDVSSFDIVLGQYIPSWPVTSALLPERRFLGKNYMRRGIFKSPRVASTSMTMLLKFMITTALNALIKTILTLEVVSKIRTSSCHKNRTLFLIIHDFFMLNDLNGAPV